jgi:hypothetical protein
MFAVLSYFSYLMQRYKKKSMYRFLSYYVVEFSNIKEPELTMPANPGM